ELRAMQKDRTRNIEMVRHGVKTMKFVHAISDGIGERVLLRVDRAGLDGSDRLGEVAAHRDTAKELEGPGLHLARQDADTHAGEVRGRVHRAQAIGNVPEAVFEIAENAIVHPRFDLAGEKAAELTVDRRARLV